MDFAENIRQVAYPLSVTLFMILGLALLAVIKYNFGKNVNETFETFFNYRKAMRLFEERKESDRQNAILSDIFFSLVFGIFVSLVFPLWGNFALSVLFFSLAVTLFYTIKTLIWKALGSIFMVQALSKIYISNMFLFNRITVLAIFPFIALIPYIFEVVSSYITIFVIIVFVFSYFLRLFSFFKIFNAQNVSIFYFILYLCALEILPLLLIVKSCRILIDNMIY